MTNPTISILSPSTIVGRKEKAEVVSGRSARLAQSASSEDLLRIANRLVMSLKPHEQVIACSGVCKSDPSRSFATHVALALVRLGQGPVLLVHASLLRPESEPWVGTSEAGLLNVLADEVDLEEALQRSDVEGLHVLPVGGSSAFQPSQLASQMMSTLVERFRQFRLVLMDVGAAVANAEGMILASKADAIVMVATTGERTRREIAQSHAEVEMLKARFLGVVLTDVK